MARRKSESATKGKGHGERVSPRTSALLAMDNSEVKKAIKQHIAFKNAKEAERKRINQEITASRNALVARGLNRKAITVAEAFAKMEDQHRDGFDVTFVIARKATGYPMQAELFAKDLRTPESSDDGSVADSEEPAGAPLDITDDQEPGEGQEASPVH